MVIDQQEEVDRGASGNDLGAPFSLLASAKGALSEEKNNPRRGAKSQ
jgi:hypothetical protein